MTLLLLLAAPAQANGQNTHVWISLQAAEQVQDPTLRALLAAEQNQFINGSMFPDGGYAVDHAYGEAGHWEGLQDHYRDWIREGMDPQSAEAAAHVAFYMGMASHGMADQSFDAFYFSQSRYLDADYGWADGTSFDEASDVIWSAVAGPSPVPVRSVPAEMPGLYEEVGIQVDADTLDQGQKLVITALELVALLAKNEDTVADYQAEFPWGGANLQEPYPGAPADEARMVAAYLDSLWVDLNQGDQPLSVVATVPEGGSYGWPVTEDPMANRLGLVFSKSMDAAAITPEDIVLMSEDGTQIPVQVSFFYGSGSHVLHVLPQGDLADATDYSLSLRAGAVAEDGRLMSEDFTTTFSTRPPPADSGMDSGSEDSGCGGCGAGLGGGGLGGGLLPGLLAGMMLRRRRR